MFDFERIDGPLKIDVGLAGDAPNSAIWLSEGNWVIGIEPLEYHWEHLRKLGSPDGEAIDHPNWKIVQTGQNAVLERGKVVCDLAKFIPVKMAIHDDVRTIRKFNVNRIGDTGSSSLISGDPKCSHQVDVECCSLEYLCTFLPWHRISQIDQVKTDCEGSDIDVVKSLGAYLKRTVYITSEICKYSTSQIDEFIGFMVDFQVIRRTPDSIEFKNKHIDSTGINNRTLGL